MTWKTGMATLALLLTVWGCDSKTESPAKPSTSSDTPAGAPADKSAPAAKSTEEPAGEMTVKIELPSTAVKAGKEAELKGFLLNKPAKISRWELAVRWEFGDGKHRVWRPDDKATDIRTVVKHAWAKAGTYTVTLEFWKGNDKVVEGTADVLVE